MGYHPNVSTTNVGATKDLLDHVITHGRLREHTARRLAHQIGSGLAFCHQNRVVHRDIKLENILISPNGDVKITNFGLSTVFDPVGHLYTACGTSYFPAPEMLFGEPYVGPEVDIWGFGVVLYILVCAKVPFDDEHLAGIHAKVRGGLIEYPAHLSARCRNLLSMMLTTDVASRRPSLSEVLSHPWMAHAFSNTPIFMIALNIWVQGKKCSFHTFFRKRFNLKLAGIRRMHV
ncbi:kinase-like domain-containing protein [Mycena capillaripes]|nr:kinase-like domain-containing protein [Mycena capillaripes]